VPKVRAAVWVGGTATAGLLAKRKPDGNIKTTGHAERDKDPQVVGEQAEALVIRVDPALYGLSTR
jgi:hypothetical protein